MEVQRNESEQGKYNKVVCPYCKAQLKVEICGESDYVISKANIRARCERCGRKIWFSIKK